MKYIIECRNPRYSRTWEYCDEAEGKEEREYLLREYKMAYGAGWQFRVKSVKPKIETTASLY